MNQRPDPGLGPDELSEYEAPRPDPGFWRGIGVAMLLWAAIAVVIWALWPAPAGAQQRMQCGDANAIAERLMTKYAEAPVSVGLQSNGNLITVWASMDKGNWTIVSTTPKGVSCILAAGKGFETFQPPPHGNLLRLSIVARTTVGTEHDRRARHGS